MKVLDPFVLFKPKKALVLGDFILDVYTRGVVDRISPEAPVLILHAKAKEDRPGGCGNAILNMVTMGMQVWAMGRVGCDEGGSKLLSLLKSEKVNVEGVFVEKSFSTPTKDRLIAGSQQLLRVDYEEPTPLSALLEKKAILHFEKVIEKVDVVAISDYAKGYLTPSLLSAVISIAKAKGKPVLVDPKSIDFRRYSGATLIKPNFHEAIAASGLDSRASLDEVAKAIFAKSKIDSLMITRAKDGISLFTRKGKREDIMALAKEVVDVTGAGDTVFAVIALSLANRIDLRKGAIMANAAAGLAIEQFGCARISLREMSERLMASCCRN